MLECDDTKAAFAIDYEADCGKTYRVYVSADKASEALDKFLSKDENKFKMVVSIMRVTDGNPNVTIH